MTEQRPERRERKVIDMLKELPVEKRKDFDEVTQGASADEIVSYAASSLATCKDGCRASCPLGVDIHAVLDHVRRKEFQHARDLLETANPLPSILSRFCGAHCSGTCSCAQHFHAVERFLGDNYKPTQQKVKAGKQKVAVIGAGVAGLTVASLLRKQGLNVRLLEAMDKAGGSLTRSTPEFRLPLKIAQQEVEGIVSNLELQTHAIGGAMHPLEELAHKFDAVVIATGANKPAFLGIAGEHLPNVYTATDYLRMAKKKSKEKTLVIGGSDLAMDAARTAKRLGDEVTLVFHKDADYMPASAINIKHAQQEGVRFMLLTKPTRIVGKGKASQIECVQMMLAESDLDDTKVAVPMENSEFSLNCDKVIVAVGLEPNPTIGRYTPLRTVGKGRLWTNEYQQTNVPNVFAAGEIALGSTSVEKTIVQAKKCAGNVVAYLNGEIKEEEEM